MKKWTHLVVFLVAATVAATSGTALGNAPYMQLATAPQQLPDGNWEYVYDVYGDNSGWFQNADVNGFDATLLVNQWPTGYGGVSGTVAQQWEWAAVYPPSWNQTAFGSYSTDGATWTLHAEPWAIDNPWHLPSEYLGGSWSLSWLYPGQVYGDGTGITFRAKVSSGNRWTGLVKTFRLVHPNSPEIDGINYYIYSYDGAGSGVITGPSSTVAVPGDFDGDGDVDADDIGDLCANLTGPGVPPGDPKYDLDGDGDADSDDMDMLIHDLVETSAASSPGTEYGDFDLDGDVDTTDLTILATNFGVGTTWLEGNANCDLVIDTTDLTILATYFGFGEPDVVPEPASAALVLISGTAALTRRRKSKRLE